MKAIRIHLISLFLIVALLAGCSPPAAQTGAEDVEQPTQPAVFEPVTLQVGYIPIGPYLPIYIGVAKGYFEEQGITIELQSFRTGAEMVAPLALGQLDVGGGEVGTAFFNAVSQDLSVRAVLPQGYLTTENSYLPLIVRKDLYDSGELDSLEEFRGKKIAVNAVRGLTEWVAAKALEAGGLTVDDAELVVIPFPEMAQAMQNGAIDAGWIQYPVTSTVIHEGPNGEPPIGVLLVGGDEVTDNAQTTAYYFGERLLAPENREIAVRMCMALIKSFRFINQEDWKADAEVIATMVELMQSSPEAIRAGVYPGYEINGRMKVESLAAMQDYYVRRGYTEYSEVIPMDKVVDESFMEEALERIGEVQP